MKSTKKAQMKTIIYIIPVLLLVLGIIFWQTGFFDKIGKETGSFLSANDYDGDGFNDAIDVCPCDHSAYLSSKAYALSKDAVSKTNLFIDKSVDRLGKKDAEIIKEYLQEDSIITDLFVSQELLDNINGKTKPSKDYFCINKIENGKTCTYNDFARDFYELGKNGQFAEVCATTREACKSSISAKSAAQSQKEEI